MQCALPVLNDYGTDWPAWSGADASNCAEGDPDLAVELASATRAWVIQFNRLLEYDHG